MSRIMSFVGCLVVLALAAPKEGLSQTLPGGDGCFICGNGGGCNQECIPTAAGAGWGTECTLIWYQGCVYCSTGGEPCPEGFAGSPVDLTPAGTVLALYTVLRSDGKLVSRCGGYIVDPNADRQRTFSARVTGRDPAMPTALRSTEKPRITTIDI